MIPIWAVFIIAGISTIIAFYTGAYVAYLGLKEECRECWLLNTILKKEG